MMTFPIYYPVEIKLNAYIYIFINLSFEYSMVDKFGVEGNWFALIQSWLNIQNARKYFEIFNPIKS